MKALLAFAVGAASIAAWSGDLLPFAFNFGGKEYRGFEGVLADGLKVSVERRTFPDFAGADWYTVWFENVGTNATALLKDIRAIDQTFPGERPVLRGIYGDHGRQYAPYEHDLATTPTHFRSESGRATHEVFPYFDLVHGDGGTLMALGWAGTWSADITKTAEGARVVGVSCLGFAAQLLPGEKVRTALVVRVPYRGRDADAASNLWRRWFLKYITPKNADGSALKPFTTFPFAGDTGLPNSDGSVSERHFTWKPTLDKLVAERIVPDFRWFDAGWYCDPEGRSVAGTKHGDWWETVGTWEVDKEKWPGMTLRESNEACHRLGMKAFAWFEPERVTHLDALCRNYGYKRDWAVPTKCVTTSDLGNPECLKWTLDRIVKMLDENGFDMYREDNNSDPAGAWKILDGRSAQATGLARAGMGENLGIQGHYALWDGIIAYCRKKGKCPFVDSCAAGGGRNDIESMRRGFPMMRSDADRTTIALRLSMTSTFCKWIPFHGSSTRDARDELSNVPGRGSDEFAFRASWLPICNWSCSPTQNKEVDFDLLRRNLAEWKCAAPQLLKDFYVLTPWHSKDDRRGWTAFAYHDPESGKALLIAFRQEECPDSMLEVTLPFVKDPAKRVRRITLDAPRKSHVEWLTAVMAPTASSSSRIAAPCPLP